MAEFSDTLALDWGDTDYLDFVATQPDGTAQDITNWIISFTLKRSLTDTDANAVLHKTTTGGTVTITNAALGRGSVLIVPADYATIPNKAGSYFGDLVGKDPFGGVNRLNKKTVQINPVVTLAP